MLACSLLPSSPRPTHTTSHDDLPPLHNVLTVANPCLFRPECVYPPQLYGNSALTGNPASTSVTIVHPIASVVVLATPSACCPGTMSAITAPCTLPLTWPSLAALDCHPRSTADDRQPGDYAPLYVGLPSPSQLPSSLVAILRYLVTSTDLDHLLPSERYPPVIRVS